jgi:hypothetical protein
MTLNRSIVVRTALLISYMANLTILSSKIQPIQENLAGQRQHCLSQMYRAILSSA